MTSQLNFYSDFQNLLCILCVLYKYLIEKILYCVFYDDDHDIKNKEKRRRREEKINYFKMLTIISLNMTNSTK